MFIYKKARPRYSRIYKSSLSEKGKKALERIQEMLKKHEKAIIAGLIFLWLTEEDDIDESYVADAMKNPNKSDKVSDNYESYLYDFADDILRPEMDKVGEDEFKAAHEDNKTIIHMPANQDKIPKPSTISVPVDEPENFVVPDSNQFDYSAFYGKWCDERAGNLIVELTENQRKNVKSIIEEALQQGNVLPSSVNRRIKDTVGLTERQLVSNQKYYNNMRNTLKENNPKLSDKEIDERAAEAARKLADKQRSDRAKSISRTELNTAHNQAAYAYVQWAIEHGYMKNVKRRWVTSGNDNVCPICVALNGQTVPFYEPYKVPAGVKFKGEVIEGAPAHTNCCCGEEFIEGDGTVQNPPSQWDKMTEAEKKAHMNYHSDKEQFKAYKKRLGKENVPKTLAEFQKLKYNNIEEWNNLKYYYRNINGRPIEYVKIDRELEQAGIKNKGKAYPVEDIEITNWSAHCEKRMKQDGISQQEAKAFKTDAIGMMKKYPAPETQFNYYCEDGIIGVRERDGNVNTVIGKARFKDDTRTIIEVMKKWLQ